jgi:ribosome-binding protein aMBF1 (putative translation factor)
MGEHRTDKQAERLPRHAHAMDAVRFGHQVRALRRRRGWRQEDLAERTSMSRGVIAGIA